MALQNRTTLSRHNIIFLHSITQHNSSNSQVNIGPWFGFFIGDKCSTIVEQCNAEGVLKTERRRLTTNWYKFNLIPLIYQIWSSYSLNVLLLGKALNAFSNYLKHQTGSQVATNKGHHDVRMEHIHLNDINSSSYHEIQRLPDITSILMNLKWKLSTKFKFL